MKLPWQRKVETKSYSDVLMRLIASQKGAYGSIVNPDNCMQSPTVHAIVTAISRRLAMTPVHIYRKTESGGKAAKERLPNHPVAKLLQAPNQWQSSYDWWQDAASTLVRHGKFYAHKSRGTTGPIRELLPLDPMTVEVEQDDKTWQVSYRVGRHKEYLPKDLMVARGPARNFVEGDSTVKDVQNAIALEILAERFGSAFFRNGAMPLLVFSFLEGSAGFETKEQEEQFLSDMKEALGGDKFLSSLLMPKGMAAPKTVPIEHDKAQFIETRKYQRTVIAGAFGVPPHLVGDLERGTFNNVEQQDKDFTLNVIMPIVRCFETSMERDLLTPADRNSGVVIRFNMDADMRASFKERQEGLQIQRNNGVINANEWREIEGKNPRTDEEGDSYLHAGNMVVDGEEMNEDVSDDAARNQEPE